MCKFKAGEAHTIMNSCESYIYVPLSASFVLHASFESKGAHDGNRIELAEAVQLHLQLYTAGPLSSSLSDALRLSAINWASFFLSLSSSLQHTNLDILIFELECDL